MQSCHENRFNFRYPRYSCRHADQNQLALDRTVAQVRHSPMGRIVLLLCMQVAHSASPVEDHPEHQDQACLATLPWHPCKPPGMPSPGASDVTRRFSACLAGRSTPIRNPCVQPLASPRTRHDLRQAEGLICHLISAKTSLIDDTYRHIGELPVPSACLPPPAAGGLPSRTLTTRILQPRRLPRPG